MEFTQKFRSFMVGQLVVRSDMLESLKSQSQLLRLKRSQLRCHLHTSTNNRTAFLVEPRQLMA